MNKSGRKKWDGPRHRVQVRMSRAMVRLMDIARGAEAVTAEEVGQRRYRCGRRWDEGDVGEYRKGGIPRANWARGVIDAAVVEDLGVLIDGYHAGDVIVTFYLHDSQMTKLRQVDAERLPRAVHRCLAYVLLEPQHAPSPKYDSIIEEAARWARSVMDGCAEKKAREDVVAAVLRGVNEGLGIEPEEMEA